MPQSRKRSGHHEFHKPAGVPAKQRANGRTLWALLFAVFGLLIAFFAAGANYTALAVAAIVAGIAGYFVGKKMEDDAVKK